MGIKKLLGARIKDLRKRLGFSQEYLSELLDMNVRQIVRIENGESFPTAENLEKLAKSLKIETQELFLFDCYLSENEMRKKIYEKISNLKGEKLKSLYLMAKNI